MLSLDHESGDPEVCKHSFKQNPQAVLWHMNQSPRVLGLYLRFIQHFLEMFISSTSAHRTLLRAGLGTEVGAT